MVAVALSMPSFAQTPAEDSLTGTVRDVSGAILQAVTVRIFDAESEEPRIETTTDARGRFSAALPPGQYRVEVSAPAFTTVSQMVTIPIARPLDVVLDLDVIEVEVAVRPDETGATTQSSLTATTLSGDALLDLPRDEAELTEYLLQLAGADATGDVEADILANFLIDGLADGRLPRPDQISQIIIDPNPMSADGRGPRIEIVTRPGAGRWRRSLDVGFADESLNARTPGEARKEPRQTRNIDFEIEGPLVPDRLEMSLEVSTEADDRAGSSLRAITPEGSLFQGVVQPQREREVEIGAGVQLNSSHRLDLRVRARRQESSNENIGGFTLPERASERHRSQWSFQVSERMFGQGLTNNLRFQVSRDTSQQVPLLDAVAIDVADAFNGGGGTNRGSSENLSVRLDDNLRWERASWNFQWTGQLQYRARRSVDEENYNGTFEFASLHDYCMATVFAGANCGATARLVSDAAALGVAPTYLDAHGRPVEITGRPTTFSQAFGNAVLALRELSFDTSLQGDRRMGERTSLRLGVRYHGTNHSRDFLRFDPTVNLQYRLTRSTFLSAGAQLTFADFTDYERLLRNDGSTHETELTISSPNFPDPFQGAAVEIGGETASLWLLSPDYRSPYTFSPQFSIRHDLGRVRTTATYTAGYGFRQRRTPNVNAPYPGTPLPDEILGLPVAEQRDIIDRMRPFFPHVGNITEIQTVGRSISRTFRLQVQPRGTIELFGVGFSGNLNYTFRKAEDDNDLDNPFLLQWGLARRDHEVQSQFRVSLPDRSSFDSPWLRTLAGATYEGTTLSFRVRANSGRLYSIRAGRDLNGDQSTRDRPLGVPRNSEAGPANWNLDLTVTKDVPLGGAAQEQPDGRRGRGDDRRVRFQARINNLLNRAQPRAFGSVLTSPLFGLPTGYTSGRTIELSMSVDF